MRPPAEAARQGSGLQFPDDIARLNRIEAHKNMRPLLLTLFLLPLSAQNLTNVLHLEPVDAAGLRELWREKQLADARWKQAQKYILRKYAGESAVAEAGDVKIVVEGIQTKWQYGMEFSPDFEVAVPKSEPKTCETEADQH